MQTPGGRTDVCTATGLFEPKKSETKKNLIAH